MSKRELIKCPVCRRLVHNLAVHVRRCVKSKAEASSRARAGMRKTKCVTRKKLEPSSKLQKKLSEKRKLVKCPLCGVMVGMLKKHKYKVHSKRHETSIARPTNLRSPDMDDWLKKVESEHPRGERWV